MRVFLCPKLFIRIAENTRSAIMGRILKMSEIDVLTTTVTASVMAAPVDHVANEIGNSNAKEEKIIGLIGLWLLLIVITR